MVVLLGGSSHVGKTMIAHKLIRKYGWECISLDCLKDAFIRSRLGNPGDRNDYEMRYWMWPFVAEIVKKAVSTKRNLIIEGCYIPAEWARSFTFAELGDIRCVFIVMSEFHIRSHINDIMRYAQRVERRPEDIVDMQRLINCSREFKEDCLKTDTFYIEIDGEYDEDSLFDAVDSVIMGGNHREKGIIL